jgi:hypothetical protein
LAYFDRVATLREMVDHIYGRLNLISHPSRPNFFVKELSLYVDHLKRLIEENKRSFNEKNRQYNENFRAKLLEGIEYYKKLIPELKEESESVKERIQVALAKFEAQLNGLQLVAIPA